jgi:glycosyltransferase involved in cell wall biosynthesis
MKIALLTDGIFPYVVGGMQRHSFYLCKYLAQQGHHVELYHMNESKLDSTKLDVFTPQERMYIRSFVVKFPGKGKSPGHYIRESYEYSKRVFAAFKENSCDADFVIAKGFAGWELLHQKKEKGFRCAPVAVNFHGYEMFQRQPSFTSWLQARFLLQTPVKYIVTHADYLFSYGGKITPIIKSLGVAEKRIIEIPSGIAPEWINDKIAPAGNVRKFVFVGRYERRKGVEELNKVLIQFRRNLTAGFEFHFIGPVPDKKQLRDSRIIYHGSITESEKLKSILRKSEVLVCPSHSEGMPNVILEAMASGCAIIGTDTGAVSELVSERTGLLLTPGNVSELDKAIRQFTAMPGAELDQLRGNVVAHIRENFLWPHIAEETAKAIQSKLVSA